jgi:hypothetical protein
LSEHSRNGKEEYLGRKRHIKIFCGEERVWWREESKPHKVGETVYKEERGRQR